MKPFIMKKYRLKSNMKPKMNPKLNMMPKSKSFSRFNHKLNTTTNIIRYINIKMVEKKKKYEEKIEVNK